MVSCGRNNGTRGNEEFSNLSAWNLPAKTVRKPPVFHLRRSPENLSTATSFGSGGSEGSFGGPGGAAGLFWDEKGERRGSVDSLVPSSGWKELLILISTSGPLSSGEEQKYIQILTLKAKERFLGTQQFQVGQRKEKIQKNYLMCSVWFCELLLLCV